MMDAMADQMARDPPVDLQVRYAATRGQGHILFAPLRTAQAMQGLAAWPDVLHVNLSSYGSAYRKLVICRAARALGVPYLIHLHGSRFREFWDEAHPWLAAEIRTMFERAARVLVLGETWRTFVNDRAPGARAITFVLRNATMRGPDRDASSEAAPRLLFLGELGKRKGVPVLVEALAALKEEPGWSAVIAGNGEVAATRAALAQRGLADRVTAPGWVGPETTLSLLAQSDILALPSFEENLPMSVIEGMAYGLAVVATPVGATAEIVRPETTGLLSPPGDAAALAAALLRLIRDRDLRHRLGSAAQALHRSELEISGYVDRLTGHWRSAAASSSRQRGVGTN